jgi:hypothetical protein
MARLSVYRACMSMLLLGFLNNAKSSTIISITGGTDQSSQAAGLSQGWFTVTPLQDVTVSALLSNGDVLPAPGTAFLTTSIGPGTTTAQEIARADVFLCGNCQQNVTLFNDLDLAAGPYWLTFGAPASPVSFLNWLTQPVANLNITTGPGVEYFGFQALQPSDALFPPGGTLTFPTPLTNGIAYDFSVTTSPVPEPGTLGIVALAFAALFAVKLSKKTPPSHEVALCSTSAKRRIK